MTIHCLESDVTFTRDEAHSFVKMRDYMRVYRSNSIVSIPRQVIKRELGISQRCKNNCGRLSIFKTLMITKGQRRQV
jgi:hypothetical protein